MSAGSWRTRADGSSSGMIRCSITYFAHRPKPLLERQRDIERAEKRLDQGGIAGRADGFGIVLVIGDGQPATEIDARHAMAFAAQCRHELGYPGKRSARR